MTFRPFPFQEHYDDDTSLPCNNFGTYLIMDFKMQHQGHQRAIQLLLANPGKLIQIFFLLVSQTDFW